MDRVVKIWNWGWKQYARFLYPGNVKDDAKIVEAWLEARLEEEE